MALTWPLLPDKTHAGERMPLGALLLLCMSVIRNSCPIGRVECQRHRSPNELKQMAGNSGVADSVNSGIKMITPRSLLVGPSGEWGALMSSDHAAAVRIGWGRDI